MTGCDSRVCLTRSHPLRTSPGVFFPFDAIHPSLISRSGVLSCIAETGGKANLPDTITLSDFTAWNNTVSVEKAAEKSRSLDEACCLVKVADALDDQDCDKWVQHAADMLVQHALLNKPPPCDGAQLSTTLTNLPNELQTRIFAAAGRNQIILQQLLYILPKHLHVAVVAATISCDKKIVSPLRNRSLPFIKALQYLPANPPSILSLTVENATRHDVGWQLEGTTGQDAAHNLAKALQYHSALTSLTLRDCLIHPKAMQLLAPAIAAHTRLQTLHLGTDSNYFPAETVQALRHALRNLTALQHFALFTRHCTETFFIKHSLSTRPPPCCLAAMLSPATALTSLTLRTSGAYARSFVTVSAALVLPCLRQLNIGFGCHKITSTFISNLSAPLTSLTHDQQGLKPLHAQAAPHTYRLLTSHANFPQLRSLDVTLPCDADPTDSAIYAAVTSTALTALAALSHLVDLRINAMFRAIHQTLRLLGSRTASLRRLDVTVACPLRSRRYTASPHAWASFLGGVSQCAQLHSLRLRVADGVTGSACAGLAVLAPLPQLSALCVGGWRCLESEQDRDALSHLSSLRRLCLIDATPPHAARAARIDCLRACAAMSALEELVIHVDRCGWDFADAFSSHAPQPGWPELRTLRVTAWEFERDGGAVVAYGTRLPALARLAFCCLYADDYDAENIDPGNARGDDEVDGDVALAGCNCAESEVAFHTQLRQVAAAAGVELAFKSDQELQAWTFYE